MTGTIERDPGGPAVSERGMVMNEVTPDVSMTTLPMNTLNNSGSSPSVYVSMWFPAEASWVSRAEASWPR